MFQSWAFVVLSGGRKLLRRTCQAACCSASVRGPMRALLEPSVHRPHGLTSLAVLGSTITHVT